MNREQRQQVIRKDVTAYKFAKSYTNLSQDIDLIAEHPEGEPCQFIVIPYASRGNINLEFDYELSRSPLTYHQAVMLDTGSMCIFHHVSARKILAAGTTATAAIVHW